MTCIASEGLFLTNLSNKLESPLSNYNSYHTNLILLYKFNSLPEEFRTIIPNSTLSSWNKKDVASIIGCDTLTDKDVKLLKQLMINKKLLLAAKALYFLFSMVSKLFQSAENKAELLRVNKSVIVDTIRKVKTVLGTKRALRIDWTFTEPILLLD